ncbi:MAG TPA: N-6 DNA methylase, partial [Planctomycetota bacterium]|nr:N-6 DNA methylase [Planctomycetota bacterium]
MPDSTNEYLHSIESAFATGQATEHTYRPALKRLLESLLPAVIATNEPKRSACGAPDYSVARNGLTIGYVEAKDTGVSLDDAEKSEQLQRYRTLPNLILTDYLEFRWYVDGQPRGSARAGMIRPDGKIARDAQGRAAVLALLRSFLEHAPAAIATPLDLARRMAVIAHEIRNLIIAALQADLASQLLGDLRQSFARALLPELDRPERASEFADMYAQTLAYGLFAARCNHKGVPGSFRRIGAAAEIPKTNPFLRQLFETITGTQLNDEPYAGYVDDLVQLLSYADINAILAEFGKRTGQEDPIVHFYETFLSSYDPKLREMRGVYYTPEPVVSYIVRSVDLLLRERFGLAGGLAETSKTTHRNTTDPQPRDEQAPRVLILDPACGTGTFLYAV